MDHAARDYLARRLLNLPNVDFTGASFGNIECRKCDGIGLKWNCTYENWVIKGADDPVIAHEVGCIHSTQGYDLSCAYIIIGNDLRYDPKTGKPTANKSSYYDRNGYATASQDELDRYIKNIYYVLLTRGILATHVYAVDPQMGEYLGMYLPVRRVG